MKYFKIIETGSPCPDVLLHIERDENGTLTVQIKAIGVLEGESEMFASEEIVFPSMKTCCRFIEDYSTESAEKWCKEQGIKYEKED